MNEQVIVRDENNNIKGIMNILIAKVPNYDKYLAYCPRGPIWDINDNDTFLELIEKAVQKLKKYNCHTLRIDPDIRCDNIEFIKLLKRN